MYSSNTNAKKWHSIALITSLVLLIGLVGLLSFNSPKNEVVADAYVLPDNPTFVVDFPTLSYTNVPNMSLSKGIMIDNTNNSIVYVNKISNFGGTYVVYDSLADQYNLLTSSVYSIRANSSGYKSLTYDNNGLKYNVVSSKGYLNLYVACNQVFSYLPDFYIHWYNSVGENFSNTGLISQSTFADNDKFELVSFTQDAPIGATKFTIQLSLDFNNANTQYYFLAGYTYVSGSLTPRISIEEVQFLSDLYKTGPYWHTRYLTSQENLRLAQEEGATLSGSLESITTAPINALAEFMTFELPFFNVNLGTILAIIVSLMLVAFVIKILISKG